MFGDAKVKPHIETLTQPEQQPHDCTTRRHGRSISPILRDRRQAFVHEVGFCGWTRQPLSEAAMLDTQDTKTAAIVLHVTKLMRCYKSASPPREL
jgi:hypothetical protein